MKMNSDYANKILRDLQTNLDSTIAEENRNKTYSYALNEKPIIPEYDFKETQEKLTVLRQEIAVLKHAINRFNMETKLKGTELTMDEALGRMSMLHSEKKRLNALLQIPEITRERMYRGLDAADYVCRNFEIEDVKTEYESVKKELIDLQQAINLANLTEEFDIDIKL